MTLTEIMKACEVENELLQYDYSWKDTPGGMEGAPPTNIQLTKHLMTANYLIKELALHVKQLKLDLNTREICKG